jgi:hypothetical protein
MYILTTFTPPNLSLEQKRALALRITVVGREEFIFALREFLARPPALGSKSIFVPDVIAIAENNKRMKKRIYTTKEMTNLAIILSVVFIVCAVVGFILVDIKLLRLICFGIAVGLPLSVLYLIASWQGMETWVTSVMQEGPEHRKEEILPRTPPVSRRAPQRAEDIRGPQSRQSEPRGKIEIRTGERSTITLTNNADASTFMHETAHDWLEQLRRDAAHPLAPQDLREDWEAIKLWMGGPANVLNASNAEELEIATFQHEYFARGFEQYLREGNAPTQELSEVFMKNKGWLTEIYPNEGDLAVKLTPKIRAVFGRMLGGH